MPADTLAAPAVSSARGARFRLPSWTRRALLAVCAVVAWVYLLAFPHDLPEPTLDLSWSAVVARAGAEHWAFGREIVLNYGPWAHLGTGFYAAPLFLASYLFQLVSKAVLVALICRVGLRLSPGVRWSFFAASLAAGILEWEYTMTLAVVYAGWLTSEDRTRLDRAIGAAGVVLAATAGLMKTFYIVFGHGVFLCVLARHVIRGRGGRSSWLAGLWPLLLFEASLGADWLIAGQKPGDLPAFLRGMGALVDGQSRAMGFDPEPTIVYLALALLLWTGGLAALWFWRGQRANRPAALPLAALFAGSLFMAWKQGVTRADAFHLSGYFCFVAVFVTILPLFFEERALQPAWHHLSIGGVWVLAAVAMVVTRPDQEMFLAHELATRPGHNLAVLFAPAAERARLDALVDEVRRRSAMPRTRAVVGQSPIDAFGTAQGLLLLNDLHYAPVPTLQGYLAYPPYLSGLDAACYQPDRAPEFVLFKVAPIDERWDAIDGALQLREILWNYRPVLTENHHTLLRRKPAAACSSPQPLLQQHGEIAFDTPLPLPADGADWCELEVRRTLMGKLVNFLYHEPTLVLETTAADGTVRLSNLPAVMARGGFLLRQPPHTDEDVAHLLAGTPVPNPIASIRLKGTRLLRACLGGTITYRFYHLDPPLPVEKSSLALH